MITTASYKPFKKSTIDYSKLIVANKAASNYDPTKTTGLRNAFVRQMDIRFNTLKSMISKAIIDQDCFGLISSTGNINLNSASRADAPDSLPGNRAFAFSRNPEKMDSFMTWLDGQEKAGILKTTKINQLGSAAEEAWTNMYIQDSYKRGVQRATYEMGKAGVQLPNNIPSGIQAVINTSFHLDRVGLLYTRSFSDLKGITGAMDTKISQILAQGLVDGDNPRILAKKINDQVDGIGKARARTLARTEIIRAHHAGMIGEYKNYGIAGVKVKAEWVTAGFNVCPKCQENEGKVYTLDEIEGLIPFHPNCRCMALPIVDEGKVKSTKNEPIYKEDYIEMYHGTSSDYIESIKEKGLVSGNKGSDWYITGKGEQVEALNMYQAGDRKVSVYIAPKLEDTRMFARWASEMTGGNPVTLRIKVPKDRLNEFIKDEHSSKGLRKVGGIPKEWIDFNNIITYADSKKTYYITVITDNK